MTFLPLLVLVIVFIIHMYLTRANYKGAFQALIHMYLTRANYKDNNLNENKIVTTFESIDELNGELNVKMVN